MWTGLVLAGGASRRMGVDKASLELGGRTLLQRAVECVRLAGGLPIVLGPPRPEEAVAGARQIDDASGGPPPGPLQALRCGLEACTPPGPAIALACDLPLLPADLLRFLVRAAPGWDAVVPRAGGELHVLSAAYGTTCLDAIRRVIARGERAVHRLLPEVRVRIIEEVALRRFGDAGIFMNVNTTEELALARARLAQEAP